MTRQEIIQYMADVVEMKMTRFKTDFFNYDKPTIEKADSNQFPFLWIVNECHTVMPELGGYEEAFNNSAEIRYAYADGDDMYSFYLSSQYLHDTDLIFLITKDDICPIDVEKAKEAIRDYTIPAYEKWKARYGEIKPKRVTVKFDLIDYSKLREIIQDCHNHNDDSLMEIFRRFHRIRRVADDHTMTIRYRKHANEFACIEHYNGEDHMIRFVIFHGWPETGYMTNNSIQIDPHYGWASHS